MAAAAFCVFETAIGSCAIAWGANGIAGASLPDRDAAALRARMTQRYPGALETDAPPAVATAIAGIRQMFLGKGVDLSAIALDMSDVPEFNRRVYEIARTIPAGSTQTYGDIAMRLGDPGLSRAVGRALGDNPFPPIVPCHRVVAASGKMHGFSARGGVALKLRMLQLEGWDANQLEFFEQ